MHQYQNLLLLITVHQLWIFFERNKKDPFHYETEGESEDIPGMPGYKFAEEDTLNERSDEFPF